MKINKILRPLTIYLVLSLMICVGIISYATYSYWQNGSMNVDSGLMVHEASLIASDISNSKITEQIKSHVTRNNFRNASDILDRLEMKISLIQGVKKSNQVVKIKELGTTVKEKISSLSSFPPTSNLISIFYDKVLKYNQFVEENNWKTLSRVSSEIVSLTVKLTPISFETNARHIRLIEQEVANIKTIVSSSILTPENKALNNLRIKAFEHELSLLKKYVTEQKDFIVSFDSYNDEIEKWIKTISPELHLKKSNLSTNGKEFFSLLMLVSGIVIGLFLVSLFFIKKYMKRAQKKIEADFELMVNKYLVSYPFQADSNLTTSMEKSLKSFNYYFHKRMGLGNIFQDSLPFAAILLDQNMRVIWANNMFAKTWDLDEAELTNELFSWDYLVRFTDIEGNDPVVKAFKTKDIGIYTIHLRLTQDSAPIPFQMHVRPLEYHNQNRIMLYFCPLKEVDEKLSNQLEKIRTPVLKSLDSILLDSANAQFTDEVAAIYEEAGIGDIFDQLVTVNEDVVTERRQLTNKISSLEQNILKLTEEKNNLIDKQEKSLEIQQSNIYLLKQMKEHFLLQHENVEKVKFLDAELIETNQNNIENYRKLLKLANELSTALIENAGPIDEMIKIKEEIRTVKQEVIISRQKIYNSVDQGILFKNIALNSIDSEKLDHCLSKIRNEVYHLEKNLLLLEKKISGLEVHLSKAQILSSDLVRSFSHKEEFNSTVLDHSDQKTCEIENEAKQVFQSISGIEEEIVLDLKEVFENIKNVQAINLKDEERPRIDA